MNLRRFERVIKRDFDVLYDHIKLNGGVEGFWNDMIRDVDMEAFGYNEAYVMIQTLETMRERKTELEFRLL